MSTPMQKTDIPCIKCGDMLSQPEPGAQFECESCGAVVAPDVAKRQFGN